MSLPTATSKAPGGRSGQPSLAVQVLGTSKGKKRRASYLLSATCYTCSAGKLDWKSKTGSGFATPVKKCLTILWFIVLKD